MEYEVSMDFQINFFFKKIENNFTYVRPQGLCFTGDNANTWFVFVGTRKLSRTNLWETATKYIPNDFSTTRELIEINLEPALKSITWKSSIMYIFVIFFA